MTAIATATSRMLEAFTDFRAALADLDPTLPGRLRAPVAFHTEYLDHPGAHELKALWSVSSGQSSSEVLGVAGGACLLGPIDSQREREKWTDLMTSGEGLGAVANPEWDPSDSLDPDAVRTVYFAAGWIPVLCEPMEGNYLAVDLVPLAGGRAGQVILCGRDEDEKCVVTPDLATLFRALAAECRAGDWVVQTKTNRKGAPYQYMERRTGRLMSSCRERSFPPR